MTPPVNVPTLRIAVLADLRGRAGREAGDFAPPIAPRRLIPVDVDNFERMLARIEPRLEIRLGDSDSPRLPIVFRRLEDFHPDALHRDMELFGPLRDIRRRLLDPSTFAAAAADWSRAVGLTAGAGPTVGPPSPSEPEDDEATHRRLLGRGPTGSARAPASAPAGLDRLLRQIVAPHIVPGADPRLPELLRSVDDTTAALLRAILHHPDYQALESVWRAVHDLVTGLETDGAVEVRLLDVTKAELGDTGAGDWAPAVERLLNSRDSAHDPASVWPLLVAAFAFGPGEDDVTLLERLGAIARRTGGPVLAAADPGIVGCRSFAEAPDRRDWSAPDAGTAARWRRLRESALAPWIGLAMPRILLRLPYGQRTDPIEAFSFEELSSGRDHEAYLWGNAAFGCARLIASSFVENGTAMEPGDHLQLDDLPTAVYDDDGEPRMKPCAEAALSDVSAEAILDAGAMPLLASSRRNTVRVMRFQSIAHPPRPLAGPWGPSPSSS
ncbi:MAG TPA: type VI secretion system contractile sheath large subunit, partial [Candidatus Binatia bacterium]|nr:type VI secretion system contractile sheath large subunit [Candidatus Binatia bacterium]